MFGFSQAGWVGVAVGLAVIGSHKPLEAVLTVLFASRGADKPADCPAL